MEQTQLPGLIEYYESEILQLENEYVAGMAEGKLFGEMKLLKTKIKLLKATIERYQGNTPGPQRCCNNFL